MKKYGNNRSYWDSLGFLVLFQKKPSKEGEYVNKRNYCNCYIFHLEDKKIKIIKKEIKQNKKRWGRKRKTKKKNKATPV